MDNHKFLHFEKSNLSKQVTDQVTKLADFDPVFLIEDACVYSRTEERKEKRGKRTVNVREMVQYLDTYSNILCSSNTSPKDAMSRQMQARKGEASNGDMTFWQLAEDYVHTIVDLVFYAHAITGRKNISDKKIHIFFANIDSPFSYDLTLPPRKIHDEITWLFDIRKPNCKTKLMESFYGDRNMPSSYQPPAPMKHARKLLLEWFRYKKTAIYAFTADSRAWLESTIAELRNNGHVQNKPVVSFQCSTHCTSDITSLNAWLDWPQRASSAHFEMIDEKYPNVAFVSGSYPAVKQRIEAIQGGVLDYSKALHCLSLSCGAMEGLESLDDFDEKAPATLMEYKAYGVEEDYPRYFSGHKYSHLLVDLYNEFSAPDSRLSEILSKDSQNTRYQLYQLPLLLVIPLILLINRFVSDIPIAFYTKNTALTYLFMYSFYPDKLKEQLAWKSSLRFNLSLTVVALCVAFYVGYAFYVELSKLMKTGTCRTVESGRALLNYSGGHVKALFFAPQEERVDEVYGDSLIWKKMQLLEELDSSRPATHAEAKIARGNDYNEGVKFRSSCLNRKCY